MNAIDHMLFDKAYWINKQKLDTVTRKLGTVVGKKHTITTDFSDPNDPDDVNYAAAVSISFTVNSDGSLKVTSTKTNGQEASASIDGKKLTNLS